MASPPIGRARPPGNPGASPWQTPNKSAGTLVYCRAAGKRRFAAAPASCVTAITPLTFQVVWR